MKNIDQKGGCQAPQSIIDEARKAGVSLEKATRCGEEPFCRGCKKVGTSLSELGRRIAEKSKNNLLG